MSLIKMEPFYLPQNFVRFRIEGDQTRLMNERNHAKMADAGEIRNGRRGDESMPTTTFGDASSRQRKWGEQQVPTTIVDFCPGGMPECHDSLHGGK